MEEKYLKRVQCIVCQCPMSFITERYIKAYMNRHHNYYHAN